jgi:hypothetical protein
MDHTEVVRTKMTERYLLDELDSEVRDEFEEHFFECRDCALDVSAGAQFVAHSKVLLGESSEPVPIRAIAGPNRAQYGWLSWLRQPIAAFSMSLLLVTLGYQQLVTVPRLQSEASQSQVLPTAPVNLGTYGAGGPATTVPEGKGMVLFVRIPSDGSYARFTAELFAPGGKQEGSFTVPATPGQDQWTVVVPTVHREAGTYTMAVHGITAGGERKDLGSTSFELQIQR